MPKHSENKPWERLEGESVKAFEAFMIYLEMGEDRSLRAVGQRLGKSKTLIDRWSSAYGWVERTAAYDLDIQRKAHANAVKKKRQMNDRHIRTALKMQETALAALAEMKPGDIDAKNMVAIIRAATALEREARAEIVEESNPNKDAEAQSGSLADAITEAWERRRQQNEHPNK